MKYFIIYCVTVLVVVIQTNGQHIIDSSCPTDREVIKDFDITKYLGKWYEIERYDQPFEKDGDCCFAEYTLNEDGSVKVDNSMIRPGLERSHAYGRAYVSFPNQTPLEGKLNVTFAPPPVPASNSNYWILDSDYTNYAIIWGCSSIGNGKSAEAGWVLARDSRLTPEVQVKVDENIDKYFVRSELRKTNQDNEFCSY